MHESTKYQSPAEGNNEVSILVELESAYKSFGQQQALSNVDFVVEENETTAIVGASGCGKSTLLQLVNGLLLPSRGTVKVFGVPLPHDNLSTIRRRIGYAVQQVGLFPHLRVLKNVTLLAELDGWQAEAIQRRFATLMELLELNTELTTHFARIVDHAVVAHANSHSARGERRAQRHRRQQEL